RATHRSSWALVRTPSASTRSHPSMTRPRIWKGSAWGLRSRASVSVGSQRSNRPPWPLTLTDMLPPIRNASPPNIRCSVTPACDATSSRTRWARSSSYATRGLFRLLAGRWHQLAVARVEHRLYVDDRRAVDGLQVAYADPVPIDRDDAHAVQTDRVRPVGRASGEHALQWIVGISARVNGQHLAAGAVQPRQHDHLAAGLKVAQPLAHLGVERQPRFRSAPTALERRGVSLRERGFDGSDSP